MIQEPSSGNNSLSDLLVVEGFAGVAVAAVFYLPKASLLLPLFALPLVFVVPGYALTAMLFPKRESGYAELLAYSLGLSLVVDILGGLLINLTAQGLSLASWCLWLGSVTLCSSIIAALRRPRERRVGIPLRLNLSPAQGLMLALSLALAVGAILIVRDTAVQPSNFTELWVLPSKTADANVSQLGVRNLESVKVAYKLEVQVGNDIVYSVPIELQPGESFVRSMVLTPPQKEVQVLLYRSDNPTQVYREVTLQSSGN